MLRWESNDGRFKIFDNQPHLEEHLDAGMYGPEHPVEVCDYGSENSQPFGYYMDIQNYNDEVVALVETILSLPTDEERCDYMKALIATGFSFLKKDAA